MMSMVWMFPGQGAQSARMGLRFMERRAFANVIAQCEAVTGRPIAELVQSCAEGDLMRTDRAQLAIFAMSMGILACLQESGQSPDLVAGHSLGHFSALVAADVLTLDDAALLVDARGRFMRHGGQRSAGGMAVVQGLPSADVAQVLTQTGLMVWPANLNLADQTVVSGTITALPAAREAILAAGGRWVPLNVSGAFHSPLLQPEAKAFARHIADVVMTTPQMPVISNADGRLMQDVATIRADLTGHMTGQVHWTAVMDQIAAHHPQTVVEVGPAKVLTGLMLRHAPQLRPLSTGLPPLLDRAVTAISARGDISSDLQDAAA